MNDRQVSGLTPRPDVARLIRANRGELGGSVDVPVDVPVTTRVTIYMSQVARTRARAAYRGTAHRSGDRSWSAFVELAVLREVEQREREFNDGQQFEDGTTPLPVGRPLD